MAVWKQGEHVALIGQTGSGKSYLAATLLHARTHVLAVQTKPDDIAYKGFKRIRSIKQLEYGQTRYVLAPKPDFATQAREVARALKYCWDSSGRHGGWCIYIDELYYASDELHVGHYIKLLATQGRSKNISLVIGVQRPVGVTRWAISEATHVLSATLEGRDVKTLAEATTPRIEPVLTELRRFEFAYYYRPDRSVQITEAHHLRDAIPNVPSVEEAT